MPKSPVTPGLQPGYHLAATGKCWSRGQILKRTYDWSHTSWMIARAKSVAARSMVMSKLLTCDSKLQAGADRSYVIVPPVGFGRTTSCGLSPITQWHDWSCNWSCHLMIGGATRCTISCSVKRLFETCPDLPHDSATGRTTKRTIGRRCHDGLAISRRTQRLIVRSVAARHD